MPEDAVKDAQNEVQKLTDKYIGTIDEIVTEKEKASAALGHAVLDADTGSLLNVRKGEMVEADVCPESMHFFGWRFIRVG